MRQKDIWCCHCLTKSGPSFMGNLTSVLDKLIQNILLEIWRTLGHETKRYFVFSLSHKVRAQFYGESQRRAGQTYPTHFFKSREP